jgi:hypothetical protein
VNIGRAAPVAGSPHEGAFGTYIDDAGHRNAGRSFLRPVRGSGFLQGYCHKKISFRGKRIWAIAVNVGALK